MRPATLVQAVIALVIGAGGGVGYLYGTGQLSTPARLEELTSKLDATRQTISVRRQAAAEAEKERLEAEEKALEAARAEERRLAEALAEEQRLAEEAAARAKAAEAANRAPAFGVLSINATTEISVESSDGTRKGKAVTLPFSSAPGKLKLKDGRFTVYLTPKVKGSRLELDVSVSPMAIIAADGERKVSSVQGLVVGRGPFALDFNSPTAGDLNLVLQFRK